MKLTIEETQYIKKELSLLEVLNMPSSPMVEVKDIFRDKYKISIESGSRDKRITFSTRNSITGEYQIAMNFFTRSGISNETIVSIIENMTKELESNDRIKVIQATYKEVE